MVHTLPLSYHYFIMTLTQTLILSLLYLSRAPNQAAFELLKVVHALDAVVVLAATADGQYPHRYALLIQPNNASL